MKKLYILRTHITLSFGTNRLPLDTVYGSLKFVQPNPLWDPSNKIAPDPKPEQPSPPKLTTATSFHKLVSTYCSYATATRAQHEYQAHSTRAYYWWLLWNLLFHGLLLPAGSPSYLQEYPRRLSLCCSHWEVSSVGGSQPCCTTSVSQPRQTFKGILL